MVQRPPVLRAQGQRTRWMACHSERPFARPANPREAGVAETRKVGKGLSQWPCGFTSAGGVTVLGAHAAVPYISKSPGEKKPT